MSGLLYIIFSCFLLLMLMRLSPNWSYTWTSCYETSTQTVLFFMPMEFSPNWSYTCSAKVPLTLGLMFNVNDFVPCSCSSFHILIMFMLSYTYASYNIVCFSISFQICHEKINLNSIEIIKNIIRSHFQ
jgi:hypothetical protein